MGPLCGLRFISGIVTDTVSLSMKLFYKIMIKFCIFSSGYLLLCVRKLLSFYFSIFQGKKMKSTANICFVLVVQRPKVVQNGVFQLTKFSAIMAWLHSSGQQGMLCAGYNKECYVQVYVHVSSGCEQVEEFGQHYCKAGEWAATMVCRLCDGSGFVCLLITGHTSGHLLKTRL